MLAAGGVAYKVLELAVGYFFRKLTKDDYVTKEDCKRCEQQDSKLATEISTIKGILLVLAVKNEIPTEQLAKLTQ